MPKRTQQKKKKDVSDGAFLRVARRAGALRVSREARAEAKRMTEVFLNNIVRNCIMLVRVARRKTVTRNDVCRALASNGMTLYNCQQ